MLGNNRLHMNGKDFLCCEPKDSFIFHVSAPNVSYSKSSFVRELSIINTDKKEMKASCLFVQEQEWSCGYDTLPVTEDIWILILMQSHDFCVSLYYLPCLSPRFSFS